MTRSLFIFVVLGLATAGCTDETPIVPSAQKEVLRKILAPEFVATSVPKEKEEEFFRVLEAFNVERRKNEFVRSVDFKSRSEATVSFADGGMHGGGVAFLKKKGGRWTIDPRLYFM